MGSSQLEERSTSANNNNHYHDNNNNNNSNSNSNKSNKCPLAATPSALETNCPVARVRIEVWNNLR